MTKYRPRIALLSADAHQVQAVHAEMMRADVPVQITHSDSPDKLTGAASLQDWLVIDVASVGHQAFNHANVRNWPGQRLVIGPGDENPSMPCATCTADEVPTRMLALIEGTNPLPGRLAERRRPQRVPPSSPVESRASQLLALAADLNRLNRRQLAETCVHKLRRALGMRLASYYQYDPGSKTLVLQCANHPYPISKLIDLNANPDQPIAWAVRKGEPSIIQDWQGTEAQSRPGEAPGRRFTERYSTRCCIIIPIMVGQRLLGVLNLADPMDDEAVSVDEVRPLLAPLVDVLTAAMTNIEVFERTQLMARTDALTELGNYRAFTEQFKKELMRARRYGSPLSLMLLDVDGLKQINDGYGHSAGDKLLQTVAERITAAVREIDIPVRTGGDEFAVILPNTTLDAARHVAQRVLETMHSSAIQWEGIPLTATISVGVGQYQGELTADEFIRNIDMALYSAKAGGRNQMAVSGTA